jgi:hypothetical protein
MISMLSYAVQIKSVSIINQEVAGITGYWFEVATLPALDCLFTPHW